jgi:hypothetical protein
VVAFGLEAGTLDYGFSFAAGDNHRVNIALINDLAPNTTYFYQIHGQNGCMPVFRRAGVLVKIQNLAVCKYSL